VLPCDADGLPVVDSFMATSFSAIETMFKNNTIAKFAYVYMAWPSHINTCASFLPYLSWDGQQV